MRILSRLALLVGFATITLASSANSDTARGMRIEGSAVKGPLAGSIIAVFSLDFTKADYKGQLIATSMSNDLAEIEPITIDNPSPPYLMESYAYPGMTTDLTSGEFPVLSEMRTLVLENDASQRIYLTPITTVTTDIALSNADSNGDGMVTSLELERTVEDASRLFTNIFPLTTGDEDDLLEISPLLTWSEDYVESIRYRTAVETFSAIVAQIADESGVSTDSVLDEIGPDISDKHLDAVIDGISSDVYTAATLDLLPDDLSDLHIPGTDIAVIDTYRVMLAEADIPEDELGDFRLPSMFMINRVADAVTTDSHDDDHHDADHDRDDDSHDEDDFWFFDDDFGWW